MKTRVPQQCESTLFDSMRTILNRDQNRGILLPTLPTVFQKHLENIIKKNQEYQKLLNKVSAFEIGFVCRHNKRSECYRLFARCRTESSEQLRLAQTEQKKACVTIKENQFIRNRLETLIGKIKKIVSNISLIPYLTITAKIPV